MAIFPKIQSPCPYKSDLAAIMDGDICRMCRRQVVDITAMSDAERVALIAGCKDEICVRYAFPVRPAVAAAALAVAAVAVPSAAAACSDPQVIEVVVGGIKDPANVQYVKAPEDKSVPELPVVYESKPAPVPVNSKAPS
jgi:hypothetical protein